MFSKINFLYKATVTAIFLAGTTSHVIATAQDELSFEKVQSAFYASDIKALEALRAEADQDDVSIEGIFCGSWDDLISHAKKSRKWNDFVTAFNAAYEAGDISTLEALKEQDGFANIDDLGGMFLKYGSGTDQWDQLIEDAKLNQAQ